MYTEEYIASIIEKYPEKISLEQMRIICHISKRNCHALLENKLVPCVDRKTATHRFQIKTTDVVAFMENRNQHPERYKSLTKPKKRKSALLFADEKVIKQMRWFYAVLLEKYRDLLTVEDVAGFTGYEPCSVAHWCNRGVLENFKVKRKYYIPKEYLLDFLISDYFISIRQKTKEHKAFIKKFKAMHCKQC